LLSAFSLSSVPKQPVLFHSTAVYVIGTIHGKVCGTYLKAPVVDDEANGVNLGLFTHDKFIAE